MNQSSRRYHPAMIAVDLISFMKGSIGIVLLLFIFKASSTSIWVIWGRYIFIVVSVFTLIGTILKWMFCQYEVTQNSVIERKGVFVKSQRAVPFSSIHNHKLNTTFIHRWLGLTSLTLETGTSGEHANFTFPVITAKEKKLILLQLEQPKDRKDEEQKPLIERTIHFQSNKKDLIKASFTSLSFLAFFPLLNALYFNIVELFHIEDTAKSAFDYLLIHWWMLIIILILAMLLSALFGLFKTFTKYGNFVISDDKDRIFIEKGIGNVISYSILKHRVQAVVVEQSILKRLLGFVEVKLISAGGSEIDGDQDTSSLYPFMPKQQAYQILQAMLPQYVIKERMERFPIKVLWLKLLLPYYLTIVSVIGLAIFKREWLWIAAIVFVISVVSRILDYWFTSYIRHGKTVQIRKGGFVNETFVTHHKRIQQVTVEHSWLQRKFNVATLVFLNRAKPMHESKLYGLSKEEVGTFYHWYHGQS
ncbi:PH domain-containing protein [Metabacillus schmidteae]|uniref:PH domain-containing protein n=1 Tax=Metabacillus schmidteae TaxID=2730405 RepID=UPI00158C63E8|nr:PH domain-containing protein [Metabacillus schmidteae]